MHVAFFKAWPRVIRRLAKAAAEVGVAKKEVARCALLVIRGLNFKEDGNARLQLYHRWAEKHGPIGIPREPRLVIRGGDARRVDMAVVAC
jgi:hypothetical protein